ILADFGYQIRQGLLNARTSDLAIEQLIQIATLFERDLRSRLHKALEFVIPRDEICLGVDLDESAGVGPDRDTYKPFCRGTARLLGGLGDAFFAQPITRRLHIAVRLSERCLAI